ncbi:MAG: hypothetical protein K2W96_12810 [Gemmataceae bacterium]|nr:hypothetical protein [Gemmataceae bacterium]
MSILRAAGRRTGDERADNEAALVEHWRKCLAGEVVPEPVPILPEVEAALADLEHQRNVKFAEEAKWPTRLGAFCQREYPKDRVVWLRTAAGPAILAVGDEQVDLFYKHFLDAFRGQAELHYPWPLW